MLGVPLTDRWGEAVMLAGAAMAAASLHFVADAGFAPDGHFPWVTALVFAAGVVLVALRPTEVSRQSADPAYDRISLQHVRVDGLGLHDQHAVPETPCRSSKGR